MGKKRKERKEEEEEERVVPHTFTMVCNMLQWRAIDSKVLVSEILTMAVTKVESGLEVVHQGQNWCPNAVVAPWVSREYLAAKLCGSKGPKRNV